MIAHSIRAAQSCELFDRIVVSTDSDEIAKIAQEYGAEVPFKRAAELADDFTGTDSVLLDALNRIRESDSSIETFCCIYPTAALLRPEDLRRGFELLRQKEATTAIAVTTFPYPIFRSLKLDARGRLGMVWPEHWTTRSQDLPEAYHDAGQFYWGDVKKYRNEQRLFSRDSVPVMIPRHLVQDIDTPADWEAAENMFLAINGAPFVAKMRAADV